MVRGPVNGKCERGLSQSLGRCLTGGRTRKANVQGVGLGVVWAQPAKRSPSARWSEDRKQQVVRGLRLRHCSPDSLCLLAMLEMGWLAGRTRKLCAGRIERVSRCPMVGGWAEYKEERRSNVGRNLGE